MSVKGVIIVTNIDSGSTDPTKIDVAVKIVGIAPGQAVSNYGFTIHDMDPTVTNVTWEAALKQAARDVLTNTFGYTFGIFDSIRLVGETLL